jgi:hypothetical protein
MSSYLRALFRRERYRYEVWLVMKVTMAMRGWLVKLFEAAADAELEAS